MTKYPALYVYRKSGDGGMELKHSIRSLSNLSDWNGEVIVVGDKEEWFNLKEIRYIPYRANHHSPYRDAEDRLTFGLSRLDDVEDFLLFNDDFFITMPNSRLSDFHQGEITKDQPHTLHKQALKRTREFLIDEYGIKSPLNYAVHTPILMNKTKRLNISSIVRRQLSTRPMLARVIYGNLHASKPFFYEDQKSYGSTLSDAPFISTQRFTPELVKLFPDQSKFELERFEVYDNTEPNWNRRYKRLNRQNGANTYSSEIVKYQVPILKKYFKNASISTTALIPNIPNFKTGDINIQYLHTYPKDDPLSQVEMLAQKVPNVVFISSYYELHQTILDADYSSIFIPMTIDTSSVPKRSEQPLEDHIIYYGNVTPPKLETFNRIRDFFESRGWTFDFISENLFNGTGRKLSQEECWDIIKNYEYGIGVGRCHNEMSAMGVKAIVAGNNIGGIVKNRNHHKQQVNTNYNSNYFTHTNNLEIIFKEIDTIVPYYEDIKDNLDLIEKRVIELLNIYEELGW